MGLLNLNLSDRQV
jgi:hypothetical protein